jgi:enoyl-CoA hydratase/carnithine racemase
MTETPYRTLLLDVSDSVALITLNRPEQLNAFTPRMGLELGHAFTTLDRSEDVRAIVVTGAGRAFCSGAALDRDASSFRADSAEEAVIGTAEEVVIGPPISDIAPWTMATPVLAAINGNAVGLGLTYPLQWDIRIAAETARMAFVFTRRGMIPEGNSLWLLSRAVGASRAAELLFTGRTFTGKEACEMGLVSRAVPEGEVVDATLDLAREIVANTSPAALAITKRLFYEQLASSDRARSREIERSTFTWLLSEPDATEGIVAFLERRAPSWQTSKHLAPPAEP